MSEVLIKLRKIAVMKSLNLSFGQDLKSSYSNESFISLAQQNEITAKKYLIARALPETEDHVDSFQVDVPSENLWF